MSISSSSTLPDEIEIIDTEKSGVVGCIDRLAFGDISKSTVAKQVAIGGGAGLLSGYLVNQVGSTAAAIVGGSVVLIQVAQHEGYITVNWTKVHRAATKARVEAEEQFRENHKYIHSLRRFFRNNFYLGSGFAAGFFLGFAL